MSEHDDQPPMTRRERRLRELAETGALDLSEALQQAKEPVAAAESAAPAPEANGSIEISPFNEDGTPRSRREMRQLREAALAEQADSGDASSGADPATGPEAAAEPQASAEPGADAAEPEPVEPEAAEPVEPEGIEAEEVGVEEVGVEPDAAITGEDTENAILGGIFETSKNASDAPETSALDFDSLMAPPTAPFSVEDLREAERGPNNEAADIFTDAVDGADVDEAPETFEAPEADLPSGPDAEPEVEAVAEPVKPKRRFPWGRSKTEAAEPSDSAEVAAETSEPEADAAVSPEEQPEAEAAPVEPASEPEDVLPVPGPRRGGAQPKPAPVSETPEPVQASESQKYSFPDIQPPEEWRSVFDDPASRTVGGQGASEKGDFDDLISRAVAQEGATGSSNTSALILPSMPDDTGGLTGPLGATGELYITGSIELPRSLGETGGHSSIHDSLQMQPISMPEAGETAQTTEAGPTPVSAKHAVSARMPSGMPVVAKPTKEKSKLPLVLGISGGGLLVVIVGLGVWGATNGMFSG